MQLRAALHGPLAGTIRLPGDKSLSHRSPMFAALARGGSDMVEVADTIETGFPGFGLEARIGMAGRA
jgi:5-enolpyruvylshikimate-3-phosphate synthase